MQPGTGARSTRLAVLASGRGTNLQAIIDGIERGEVPAHIAVVISNHPNVLAIERAKNHGLDWEVVPTKRAPDNPEPHRALLETLERYKVDLIVLAGYDRIVHRAVVERYRERIINIHPSLLPAFGGGLHAQADALEYGVKITGCTVHFVSDEVDGGPIVLQAAVPVLDHDTIETLANRILQKEHIIFPLAIRLFAEGRLRVEGRRVLIEGPVGETALKAALE